MGVSDNQQVGTALGTARVRPRTRRLPPWRILLHNDNVNDMPYVVETIVALTRLNRHDAVSRMLEAHTRGLSLLLTTHREHAELLDEQFQSKRLKVTIEPAD
ncbi:MAG: ATP-dependent Clp protease adaptor ClpS [Planctomycetota bacterium]|nr:MAG: ATP-dependent Clp protease adaptor ClpS [Planctomycetota bacterium]